MVFETAINIDDEELDITMLLDVYWWDRLYVLQWVKMNGVPVMM